MINWYEDLPTIKPKYLAIMQLIKALVQEGKLISGQKLPAERELARLFKVDRSTVTRALSELAASGLLDRKKGSGTFIAQYPQLNEKMNEVNWTSYLERIKPLQNKSYHQRILQARVSDNGGLIDAAMNELPLDLIPKLGSLKMEWNDFLLAQRQEQEAGYQPLIQTIGQRHNSLNQFDMVNQSLIITGGAQQSLVLIIESLLDVGDAVAIIKPSYFSANGLFETLGVHTFSVPMVDGKIDINNLRSSIIKHRLKMLILNPTIQNPTGTTLNLTERKEIIDVCQKYQVAIVEDDVFGWLVKSKDSVPNLKKLAPNNVIYISSLSKVLGSSTRIGWIIAPEVIGKRILQIQKGLDTTPSMLAQMMANLALESPHFDEEIAKLIDELDQRRRNVRRIFRKQCPSWIVSAPIGGFYLWVTQSSPNIFNDLHERGILVKPGPIYGAGKNSFRFNFAGMSLAQQEILFLRLTEEMS